MKHFESPKIEILQFSVEDIITTSNEFDVMPLTNGGTNEFAISSISD